MGVCNVLNFERGTRHSILSRSKVNGVRLSSEYYSFLSIVRLTSVRHITKMEPCHAYT
jgi:hypothetical protein